ncbi:MAG: primosomal protein N' [Rikenellaceae bacterium]
MRYADIVLPIAQGVFTYEVGDIDGIELGDGVAVQFGARGEHHYTGIVWRLHNTRPEAKRVRKIVKRLYSHPLLDNKQRELWEWISKYYICTLGEVMIVALPSLIKPSGKCLESFERDEYKPREELYITLNRELATEETLAKLSRRAAKQHAALEEIIEKIESERVPRRLLSADLSTLRSLEKKLIISIELRRSSIEIAQHIRFALPTLSAEQSAALESYHNKDQSTTLLHGITGSGKTELYIHLIADVLARGGDVLLLLPEIALTAQLIERMERIFSSRVIAYHSKLSPKRRTEIYLDLTGREGGSFVVGVRSAIFLPLRRLELTIIDEEHDSSYKQHDPQPRYNARDCAVMSTTIFSSRCLLGSATPSLESWHNAQDGKYGLISLRERYGTAKPPRIILSDTIRATKRGERRGHFNFTLIHKIEERLERCEQVMLFQNRRGFSPFIECADCGWSARCPNCNVSLTLHKGQGRLICHYCGHSITPPERCPTCSSIALRPMGFGTEKIEEQIVEILPQARVTRLDRDALTSPTALERIIGDFARGESDIMVGTQMITKGFDFERVTLVGILNADNLLLSPDFRAEERAYQLIAQVSGRAGRRGANGEVVIQSSQVENRILDYARRGDFEGMASALLAERKIYKYPPYSRLISLTLRHRDPSQLNAAANDLGERLRAIFARRVQGPSPPPVDRVREEWLVNFILKIEIGASNSRARELLCNSIDKWRTSSPTHRSITLSIDVDPQ